MNLSEVQPTYSEVCMVRQAIALQTSLVIGPTSRLDISESNLKLYELMVEIARQDHVAFAELYGRTSRLVYGLVRRILNNPSLAEEVALEVYMQVWKQAGQYDAARGSPITWLVMIARSRSIDSLRSRQHEKQDRPVDGVMPLIDHSPSPEEIFAIGERQEMLRSALDSLQLNQRQVIELAFYSGLSHTAIAQKLGQPVGTVKSRIRVGMLHLRDLLHSHGV